jgi:hypothetical protein
MLHLQKSTASDKSAGIHQDEPVGARTVDHPLKKDGLSYSPLHPSERKQLHPCGSSPTGGKASGHLQDHANQC